MNRSTSAFPGVNCAPGLVTEIAAEDAGIFLDIDTPEAYRTLNREPTS